MDDALARFANHLGAGIIDPFTSLICAVPFLAVAWPLLFALAVWGHSQPRRALIARLVIAVVLFVVFNELVLKHALGVYRERPYLADPDIVAVGFPFTDSSFPSSHAASTAAGATVLGHAFPRFAWLGVAAVLVMDFARVHNGMHYPSDVLSGTVFGVVYGAVAIAVVSRVVRPPAAG